MDVMETDDLLKLTALCPVKAQNAGLFISRGRGIHPTRVISSHELIFVKEGELDMWEEDRTFEVKAGHTLHLFPGRRHGGSTPMAPELKFYWIHFDIAALNADAASAAGIEVPQLCRIYRPERLESLYRDFLDQQESGELQPYSANLLMMLMLTEAARRTLPLPRAHEAADGANVIAARAHTYIRMNYDQPISPARIAEAIGYNPDYLGRVYRKVYGCTLTDAIHRRRIERAKRYLMDSEMTIEQIALACGFTDPDYFRRIFRRYMQTPPVNFRNLYARVHVNTQ
jgi:AraC-like DNA-binding protein